MNTPEKYNLNEQLQTLTDEYNEAMKAINKYDKKMRNLYVVLGTVGILAVAMIIYILFSIDVTLYKLSTTLFIIYGLILCLPIKFAYRKNVLNVLIFIVCIIMTITLIKG